MEPMIVSNRDLVTIRRKNNNERFVENDVVLYWQKGNMLLHRVVQVKSSGEYVVLGDNCSRKEYGIFDNNIVGVLVSFKHKGIHYEVTDKRYKAYVSCLRRNQWWRMNRKLVYDFIIRHMSFAPDKWQQAIKSILRKIVVKKIKFE